jgi:hypothetical protein
MYQSFNVEQFYKPLSKINWHLFSKREDGQKWEKNGGVF